jgi:hypothetical protein
MQTQHDILRRPAKAIRLDLKQALLITLRITNHGSEGLSPAERVQAFRAAKQMLSHLCPGQSVEELEQQITAYKLPELGRYQPNMSWGHLHHWAAKAQQALDALQLRDLGAIDIPLPEAQPCQQQRDQAGAVAVFANLTHAICHEPHEPHHVA